MNITRTLSLATFALTFALGSPAFGAAQVNIAVTTGTGGSGKTLVDNVGAPLSAGTVADGDGAVIQIGYFTTSTAASLFSGAWVPLTGNGGANSAYTNTSVGDGTNSATSNRAIFTRLFDVTDPTRNQLPPAGTLLGVRVYNRLTVAASSFFETVASPDWIFLAPADPPLTPTVSLAFNGANVKLQSTGNAITGSTVATVIPTAAPEPTSLALLAVGLVSIATRRQRKAK